MSNYDFIHSVIKGHCRWFIAGGSLLKNNGDIDLYFRRGRDFVTALHMFDSDNNVSRQSHSDNAVTFNCKTMPNVQLIFRSFGNPIDIINGFDINKSAQAVDSEGRTYRSADFDEPLQLREGQFRWNTVTRFDKYIVFKNQQPSRESLFKLFDTMVAHDNCQLANYYASGTDTYLIRHSASFVLSPIVYPHFIAYLSHLPIDDALYFMQNIVSFNTALVPQLSDPSFYVEYLLRLATSKLRPYIPADIANLYPEWSI